ncbi:GNAT family N-acetyltransferase [Helicobacter sp. 23-1048]
MNLDLQDFLHNKAITFENNLRSRTYLYADNQNKRIIGYFTIAINYLETANLDRNLVKYINGHDAKVKALPCYLIGQIALSDEYRSQNLGKFLLDDALEITDDTQHKFGGRFIMIDSVNDKKVLEFYRQNSFVEIQNDKNLKSIKMIKPYF